MKLNLPKTTTLLNRGFVIAFLLLTLLCMQAHEFAHHIVGGISCGEFGYMTFNHFWTIEGCSFTGSALAVAAGPLLSYTLMWIGMFLLLKSKRYELLGFCLIFANLPLGRVFFGADERHAGIIIGTLFAILLVLPPLITAYRYIKNKQRLFVFVFFLFVPMAVYDIIALNDMSFISLR
ncbi:hypothetical protein CVT91_02540 [Candidatus Atribacteria bacterium HGW-Atribacteria-1]|nr:MAG: hypothetical protein CVT91_02540 [Candidatus Atribacteria bacterium HGW-Atribacteria-1]